MNPWPFVIAAYGLTVAATLIVVILSWRAMRKAEAAAAALKQ
jgi:hypothetical protein